MKQHADLDIFEVYTRSTFHGSRGEIVAQALASPRTRDLVWLYLAVNEIPWKRLAVPLQLAGALREQGEKASRLAAVWRTATRYWLGRPFRVWYAGRTQDMDTTISRSEEQRWRETIWLRKTQLTPSSMKSSRSVSGQLPFYSSAASQWTGTDHRK
jgi:hypothetical protein